MAEVHVCHAGTCLNRGAEGVLTEIEELASTVSGIEVQASGCLGNCNQAPNAMLVKEDTEDIFARLCDLPAAAAVAAQLFWRQAPFGEWLPNTVAAKTGGGAEVISSVV